LSRFRTRLGEDLRREVFVRDIFTLEHAYQLVQDLDRSQSFPFTRRTDYRNNTNKATTLKSQPSQSQSRFGFSNSTQSVMIKAKELTVSHLDRFNRLDVLSVKDLVTLLHKIRARQEL